MNRSILIAAFLALGLTACGEKPGKAPVAPAPAPAVAPAPAATPAPAPAPVPDAMKSDAPKADAMKSDAAPGTSAPTAPSGDTKKDPKQPG